MRTRRLCDSQAGRLLRIALSPLLAAAGIAEADTTLHESQLGTRFTLRFAPAAGIAIAADAVQAVLSAKKDDAGEWRCLTATSPAGVAVNLFVDRDKSYASRRVGRHLSRAAASLRESHPDKQFEIARSASAVCHQWAELVRLRFEANTGTVATEWGDAAMALANVDGTAVRAVYADATRSARGGRQRG